MLKDEPSTLILADLEKIARKLKVIFRMIRCNQNTAFLVNKIAHVLEARLSHINKVKK
jgi:hypothetical protein